MAVTIELDNSEALLLYNLFSQIDEDGELTIGTSEKELISALKNFFETRLEFKPDADYDDLIAKARKEVKDKFGD